MIETRVPRLDGSDQTERCLFTFAHHHDIEPTALEKRFMLGVRNGRAAGNDKASGSPPQ
jgi:hypothetical protein